ncbi:MAG: DUF3800 domain-containing protein [Candidatus Pacebacteria bacterium]|jgi:hypothetical protein|nr:DUF3800 domain-containing protein [Candidatus Paceibacterota bacterium]MDD5013228.1 DUF3800 domain-containing protein [Candidatus Paceibacterota bacterium]MDD5752862.1 DUF3800 domain-containing protein [Candidatus Paceibacterota bacterium]
METKNYIFIDESGKPEVYSSKGLNLVENGQATKFLVLSAIRTQDQLNLQQKVIDFKSQILKEKELVSIFSPAYALDSFHANSDYIQVRERFYSFINTLDIKIDVLVVEKLKCYSSLKENPGKLYGVMAGQLLKNICHQAEETEIIFSRKDSKFKLRKELEIEVERIRLDYLEKHPKLNTKLKLSYQHNPHYTHAGLQIADYIAYAVFQFYENKKTNYYEIIKNKVGKIQDICNKKYFTQSNPLKLST